MFGSYVRFSFLAWVLAMAVGLSTSSPSADAQISKPAPDQAETDRVKFHYQSLPHATTVDPARFTTNRSSNVELPLPSEKEAFTFSVFGDRTGGVPEGIEVLRKAVRDVNLLEPDLVMTVGDLIQGYNETNPWLVEMREYKDVMSKLLCPWFPVAGNHDIYFRGPNRPDQEHEQSYEMHFGPLWYAFEHKNCWFIVLYSDEGNPQTGVRTFSDPESQRMSPAQFSWLKKTLTSAKEAQHVFLFLHHPRWLGGGYGDDWNKVHAELVSAGNVRIVFAGHIHRMRYDGPRDGIEYVTLATVGGGQSGISPKAGYLHQYHLVTVRKRQIALASLPVGEVMNVREITGEMSEAIRRLAQSPPKFASRPVLSQQGRTVDPVAVELFNPTSRPVEFTIKVGSDDPRWVSHPDHIHVQVPPGQRIAKSFDLQRFEWVIDDSYRVPELIVDTDYLAVGARIPLVQRRFAIPLKMELPSIAEPRGNMAAVTSNGNCLAVDSGSIDLPDGPMTLECWFQAKSLADRVGLVAKTEGSEYGIFVSGGLPYFTIHVGGRYVEAQPDGAVLEIGTWHHVAGVYDGKEVRTYVDGRLMASESGHGDRRTNGLSLMIGADVDSRNLPNSFFDGLIDSVRLSSVARYSKQSFTPARRWENDDATSLLFDLDGAIGPFVPDRSGKSAHATTVGSPEFVEFVTAP